MYCSRSLIYCYPAPENSPNSIVSNDASNAGKEPVSCGADNAVKPTPEPEKDAAVQTPTID